MVGCILHSVLQLNFIGFIRVNAQNYVLSAYEVELWSLVLEPCHSEYIPYPVPIKPCDRIIIIKKEIYKCQVFQ